MESQPQNPEIMINPENLSVLVTLRLQLTIFYMKMKDV